QRGIHVMVTNPGNRRQFDCHNHDCHSRCHIEVRNEKGKRVPDASKRCHQTAHSTAYPRVPSATQCTIVRQSFSEAHTDPGSEPCRHAHQKGVPAVPCSECRRKNRGQCRDRSVHEAG